MPKIFVKSRGERFRRAGFSFTREGVELDIAKLKKGVLEQLQGEPALVVSEVVEAKEIPAEKKAREEAEKKAREEAAKNGGNAGANDQGGKA